MLATLSLRALCAADRNGILRLLESAGNFSAAEIAVGMELVDHALARPGQADYRFVVAEDGSGIAGYACWGLASLSDGTWDLYWIAVSPDRQGRGFGRQITEHCEADVRREGGRCLLIETSSRAGYEGTLAFYRSLGYEVLARLKDYYTTGDDKVILGKYFPR
ncbi:MAG: GNAT family N-acetyltransferase [Candidatus Brocadiae bacterium]|nr:GNAT family N-acetyltransferase [Candidatus Brocadiia bacterium]